MCYQDAHSHTAVCFTYKNYLARIIFKTITSVYVQMTELETYMLEMQALNMLMLCVNRQHVQSLRQKTLALC